MTRAARLARLERKARSPFTDCRFVTHVTVEPDDPRCGTHEHRPMTRPFVELLIFACTREGYCAQRDALREHFFLLEG